MCRLASLLDSILCDRELRLVAGGSCQISVKRTCLSFCSRLSSVNERNASPSANFIQSKVWQINMSQNSLSSCWGCLSCLHFSPTMCICASESSYWVSYLFSHIQDSFWQGKNQEDHAGTALLASTSLSGHVEQWMSLMGSSLRQAPRAGVISSPDMAR